MKLTEAQKKQIVDLKNKGYSSRKIAEIVLGFKSKKSTINDFLNKYKTTYMFEEPILPKAKILFLDIENAPCIGYYWQRWKTTIHESQVKSESFILSYAYSWLGDEEVVVSYLKHNEVINEDDSRLVKELQKLLSEADIVVVHNGIDFDIPIINTRMVYHDIKQPLPYKIVDTCRIAKKYFRFPSNSLKSLANYLKLSNRKSETNGFEMWKGYLTGNKEFIDKMTDYNANDVIVLEELYIKLRPWDKLHPNVGLYDTQMVCPTCGSDDLIPQKKQAYTGLSSYKIYTCNNCGKHSRTRDNIANRENLLNNIQ